MPLLKTLELVCVWYSDVKAGHRGIIDRRLPHGFELPHFSPLLQFLFKPIPLVSRAVQLKLKLGQLILQVLDVPPIMHFLELPKRINP